MDGRDLDRYSNETTRCCGGVARFVTTSPSRPRAGSAWLGHDRAGSAVPGPPCRVGVAGPRSRQARRAGSAWLRHDRGKTWQCGTVSLHLNRRLALIALGQGMAGVLLAACGRSGQSAELPSPTPAASGSARPAIPSAPDARVTVPALRSTETANGRSGQSSAGVRERLPLSTVSTPTRSSPHPLSPSAAVPPGKPAPVSSATVGATEASGASATTAGVTTTTAGRPRTDAASSSTSAAPGRTSASVPGTSRSTEPTGAASGAPAGRLAGKVVAIDPGHNGANAEHPEIINQLIDGGYGERNVCNTTGTQTDDGYPEHQFAWQVASLLRPMLEAHGITVVMTRSNDTGVGPCTNKRAAIENDAEADAVVSIHGDGAPADVRGFYVLTATRPPAGPVTAAESLRLAASIARSAVAAGFPPSNTLGSGGLWKRDDLTGLNLSTRPKILIECGNMRNAAEAAVMSSNSGQRRYAQALADGVVSYLRS